MPIVTAERMQALAPRLAAARASDLATEIEAARASFGVSTPLAVAHFMAQSCLESGYFARFEENLLYTHAAVIAGTFPHIAARADELVNNPQALANAAYGGRDGNRDEASGDGWRYRGRGLFGLTGRANYAAAGIALNLDLLGNPDLAAQPNGVLTALWFWRMRGCNAPAAADNVEGVTRLINGGTNGLLQRVALTDQAKSIFT
jgi:putative chitinase